MLKAIVVVFAVALVFQYGNVKGSPLSNYEKSIGTETRRYLRTYPSSFSGTRLSNSLNILQKKISALEKYQKEILELVKLLTTANKSTPCHDESSSTQPLHEPEPHISFENVKKGKVKPAVSHTVDDNKTGNLVEDTKKDQAQSNPATVKSEGPRATAPSTDVADDESAPQTGVNEEETSKQSKTDDARTNAAVSENEQENTTSEKNENGESSDESKRTENSDVVGEVGEPQVDRSTESSQKLGNPDNVTVQSILTAVPQTNEENGVAADNMDSTTLANRDNNGVDTVASLETLSNGEHANAEP
ncbi:uncharacterized protein LOC143424863 [Xylocopa sonorina]|uniref:uncharacterized protein LOC143424863 n=1 Tax=Xylocopa sonorina TaxID=1818115 RepID=UPI00403A8C36